MRVVTLLASPLAVLIAGCVPQPADNTPIRTAYAYASLVSGRTLIETNGRSVYNTGNDRRITGSFDGAAYTGIWTWKDDQVCYDGYLEGSGQAEICGTVTLSGNLLSIAWSPTATSTYRIE